MDAAVEIAATAHTLPDPACYVAPSSYAEQIASAELFIQHGKPVLLCGPTGCGKSALLHHLAARQGRSASRDLITIQLCKDADGRALLGSYHCTEIGGEFKWVPGILARVVMNSCWVILDDLDSAPMDVVSVLLTLIQTGALNIPEIGSTIQAGDGFRIFATLRTHDPSIQQSHVDPSLFSHFKRIYLEKLPSDEILMISRRLFPSPSMQTFLPELLRIFSTVTNAAEIADMDARRCVAHRLISLRDFLKSCQRISSYLSLNSRAYAEILLQDVCDCFVAFVPGKEARLALARQLGVFLGLPSTDVDYNLGKRQPVVVDSSPSDFRVGRVSLAKVPLIEVQPSTGAISLNSRPVFSLHPSACRLLESLCMGVAHNEALLLVGETGTGKTTCVQYLAEKLGRKLHVINLSQQAELTDILGGYKPIEMGRVFAELQVVFLDLFRRTFSLQQNVVFIERAQKALLQKDWTLLATAMRHIVSSFSKRKNADEKLVGLWTDFAEKLAVVERQLTVAKRSLLFTFLEGTLVTSYRSGEWVLLDEINLATPELLASLSHFIDNTQTSFLLIDRGDDMPIRRHPDFRLLACMNPATDLGKRDLPAAIRSRFTEIYCDDLSDRGEVRQIVVAYLQPLALNVELLEKVVELFFILKTLAETKMVDGVSHKPHYSLRTFTQALKFAVKNPMGKVVRSLYEGFCLSYLTQLSRESQSLMKKTIAEHLFGEVRLKHPDLSLRPPRPTAGRYELIEGYWIACGQLEPLVDEKYILTETVKSNLTEVARAVSDGQVPVLLQGETSIGKTSLITWLARATGNRCVRINNHEHTDLQDYLGSYQPNEDGKLVFCEGILVDAVRKGYWIILDELNLAPSDVLEALNRLLDANRELFITETQQIIRAHPHFMLFATQNPPGYYGGRKALSRAFRNRFIEMHFDEIPREELVKILQQRCDLPEAYAKKMISVMVDLQTLRKNSGIFAGKQGFITLRDLFRWAERYRLATVPAGNQFYDWSQHLAEHGFMLLAGRVRRTDDADVVKSVVEKHFKVSVSSEQLFGSFGALPSSISSQAVAQAFKNSHSEQLRHLVWTSNWQRLVVLAGTALQYGEAVLLVGDTGCGKTTVCQLYADLKQQPLLSVNCHMNTETADFLGGLRPARHSSASGALFEWNDGPLVAAMQQGAVFLLDEISLADDAVLERLNSLLEPERTVVLTEKGAAAAGGRLDVPEVCAAPDFRLVATMNPGGDFGKKELSPALRNRFTEIWCRNLNIPGDLRLVMEQNLWPEAGIMRGAFITAICEFIEWMVQQNNRLLISTRDVMSLIKFMNAFVCAPPEGLCRSLSGQPHLAYYHGCLTVFHSLHNEMDSERIGQFIGAQFHTDVFAPYFAELGIALPLDLSGELLVDKDEYFGVAPFVVKKNPNAVRAVPVSYSFDADSVKKNLLRIIRGMAVTKGVLLEGSPGIGKTSIITALARACGYDVVRINLSEQTDIAELFGADMPVCDASSEGLFAWRDGPFLQGLKRGSWILLDELNLASQSVLEGLNACLDHRGEVFIPELNRTFTVDTQTTRIFACQNPLAQGAGRKGLPKSFLNRFTQVLMEALSDGDLLEICCRMYPGVEKVTVERMLLFNAAVEEAVGAGQEGRPWEFNLRDVMRWCDLLLEREGNDDDGKYQAALVDLLYAARFRTVQDRQLIWQLAQDILGISATSRSVPARQFLRCEITESYLHLGVVSLERGKCPTADSVLDLQLLQSQSALLEKLAFCVKHNFVSLLVGGAGVGKAAAVQLLAALCGQRLETMYLNSALDATELLGGFQQVSQAPSASAGRFEWRDSVVVRAIRDGGWLLLDGANLCSAAVLDRLNSVLEPHGELLLSECGTVGEAVPCIKPHPNFRLFLVMDRKYGELSRAMRNRAIEIFVPALLNQRDEETLAAQLGVPLNDIGVVLKGLHHQIPSKDLSVAALRDVVEETMMRRSIGASLDGALSKAVCSVVTSLHSLANDTVALYVNGDPVQELVHPPFPVVVRDIMSHPAQTNTLRNRRVVEFIAQQLHRMETQPVVLATCLEIFFLTAFSAEAQLRKISAEEFLSTSSVLFPMQQMEMEKWPERPETRRWLVSWIFRTSSNAAPNLSLSSIQRDVQEHFSIVQQWTHQEIQRAALGIESFVAGMWLRSLAILLKHPLDRSLLSLIWMLFLKNLHPSDEIIEKSAGKLDIQLLITQDKERIRFRRCFDTVRPFATENEFLKHRILSECRFSADSVENGKTWNIFQKSLEICDSDGVSDFRSIFNMDLSAVFVKKIITGNTVDFIEKITENCRFFPDAVRETVMYSVFDLSVKSVEFDVGKSVASEIFPWEFSLPTVNRILHEIVKKLIFGNSEKVTVALKDVDDVVQRFGELRSVFWRRLQCRQLKMSEKEQVNFFLNFWNGRLQTDATCPQELWKILADNGNFEGDVGKLEKNILEGVEMLVAENERRSVAADWMALGICGMKVFCPPTVDPVQKVRVKRQCLAQQEDDCQTSLHVVDEYFTRLYGSADPENYDPLVSEPYHAHLTFCRRKLAKLQALPEVYRPANSTYFAMVQDAGYVRENCLKTGSELSRALAEKDVSKRKKVVDQLGSWLLSVVAVVDELKRKYLVYRDILLLFLSSLHQFIHGWRLIFHDLRESIFLQESEISDTVRQTVQHLSPLSNPDFISVAKRLWTSRLDILRFFRHSTGEMVATELKLIRFILRLIQLHQKIAGSSLIANKLTDAVMRRFALIWSEIEEQKKREVVEKETLYTFAGETVFPTYQNVFSDVYKKTDAETIEKIQPEVAAENRIILTENLCSDLIELHSAVVNERTGVPTPELMRILSAEGLEMKFLLEKQAAGDVDFSVDFLGILVEIRSACKNLDDAERSDGKKGDFYRGKNIPECRKCLPVLRDVETRVAELLSEWPSHPVLLEASMVIQRILSFPATEPVAKFLAGLELLLDRCQHWEAKAHSGVSLQPQLEQISRLVLDWRRLELAQWTTALDAVQRDAARSATGWWLHLFTSVHQLLAQGAAAPLPALMAALQRWMEAGSLGTFGAGLALLETMERHFARLPGGRNTTGRDVVCCVLRNIRGFYGQFAGDVEQLVSSRRAAIEKELKNFVKIARWSDMNYFSLEQTVKKSHRKVMDLMRQFANVLDERVSLVKPSGNLSVFVAPDLNVVLRGLKTSSAEAVPARLLVKIANLPALTQRSAVLVRRICRRLPLSTAAAAVAAIGDQAAIRWNELDEPALPTEMPVEKKKAALKALIQRRRLAYTDVKKQLQEIGASWRKGCGIQRSLEDFTGALSGVALNASLTAPRDACLQLFQRVLAQMAVFQRQLEKPFQGIAGEAGVMKGLVQHLHALILQQAHSAAEMAGKMTPLGGFLRGMARPAVDPAWPVIVGKDCLQLLKKAQSIVCSLQGAAEQYRLILDAVPEKQTNETVMDLLYAEDSERPLIVEKNTEQWNSAEQLLKNILSTVEKHRGVIVQHASTLPPLGGPAELALLHALRADLPGLRQAFSSLHDKFGCFPHGAELLRDLDDFSAELASGNPSAEGAEQWADPLGKLIVAALKGVQNMLPTTKLSENSDGELNIAVLTDNIGHWQNLLNIARVGQRLNNFVTGANRSVWDTALNQLIALADVVVNNYSVLAGAVLRDAFALMAGTSRLLLHLLELFGQIVAQGFGSGKVPEEEESDGKGEKFEEVEQAGLGEGEGTKDVSQEIESEDQLEESHVAGEKKEPEVQPNAPAEEEHGVEMSEDFDAEMDDVQRAEQDEINEDDAEDEKEDDKLDQQMGDLGDDEDNIDNLDEEVWRDDAEAEEEDDDTQDKKEVNGKGQAQADQQKLVAKDDNLVQGEEKQQGDDTPAETEAEPTTDQEMNEQDVENDGKPTEDLMPENVDENPEDDEMDGEEEKIPEDGENAEEAPEAAPDEEMSGVAETEEKAPEMQQDQNMQPPASANGNDEAQTAETGTEGHGQSLLDFPKENLNESEQDADAENETGTQGAALDALGRERGQRGAQSTPANAKNKKSQPKKKSAEPQKRTLGDPCQAARKRRRVVENSGTAVDELKEQAEADAYEHVASDSEQLDAQAVDVGSHDEALQQKLDGMQLDGDEEEDVPEEAMQEDEETPPDEAPLKDAEKLKSAGKKEKNSREKTAELIGEEERVETEGEFVRTADTDQPEESFFHTQREYLQRHLLTEEEAEKLRKELAEQTSALLQPAQSVLSAEQRQTGMELWRKYEMLTAGLAYELCEQLRLVLEPTKKAKMRGDYRSGKRLNMRRVIAYVASEFRKDKIWLRRSLPSQRQYQILLAVDDSASMADNRTKELAFESVAVIRQALSLLQVGEVGVCRFGQGVEMLLPLGGGASGSSEDAAAMLSRFTFAQKRTNVPLMLESVAGVFQAARTRLLTVPSVAQLLLIVSDGRGVFQDGDERVERAVRSVVGAGVFVVFLILDNPTANPTKQNDESIVKHEKVILHDKGLPTQRVERRSYMQCFPFPFYLVLRSVRQLPNTLCDALRQWFELIAAQD